MKLFVENESRRNFSKKYNVVPSRKKQSILKELIEAGHPYFLQNNSKSINIPINFLDCNRIFDKINEIEDDSSSDEDNEFSLWLPHHQAILNLVDMTAVIESEPDKVLKVVKGKTY